MKMRKKILREETLYLGLNAILSSYLGISRASPLPMIWAIRLQQLLLSSLKSSLRNDHPVLSQAMPRSVGTPKSPTWPFRLTLHLLLTLTLLHRLISPFVNFPISLQLKTLSPIRHLLMELLHEKYGVGSKTILMRFWKVFGLSVSTSLRCIYELSGRIWMAITARLYMPLQLPV